MYENGISVSPATERKIKKIKYIFLLLFLNNCIIFSLHEVLFTPRNNIRARLIQLIQEEGVSIHVAMYMLTEKSIAQALVDAYVRGVKIFLILDQISMGEKYGKGLFLQNNGLSVVIHDAPPINCFCAPIMHHKFFIFGYNTRLRTPLLWTGSYNCTASASTLHDENVLICDDRYVIEEYKKCFKMLHDRLSGQRGIVLFD